jgi:hypothetical protein
MRILFGPGAVGETIQDIQRTLAAGGFDPHGCDGIYGAATAACVRAYQQFNAIPPTGTLDERTWQSLMKAPAPSVSERCLQLTAAFEGHGFGHAVGNFDGALLTWGIVGFTLVSGGIQSIVSAVNNSKPELVQSVFGDNCCELLDMMRAPRDAQTRWANQHTQGNGALAEPWHSLFATFGSLPEVRCEQLKLVDCKYMQPAIRTAKNLGLSSELGLALCFDIHVQNGGVKRTHLDEIGETSPTTEEEVRVKLANLVAETAIQRWREDVRVRKLTIATGKGTVHGRHYVLTNWGLSADYAAPELTSAANAAFGAGTTGA